MIYNSFKDLKLSALGMGALRFPLNSKDNSDIDEKAVEKMVEYAMQNGINYYDTAYHYHESMSEIALGNALKHYDRESFYLADKFPGHVAGEIKRVEEIFEHQLKKCQVEYFDFYLFHNVCEMSIDGYLDEKYGVYDYLMKQKERGRIRHLGFSTHGNYDTIKRFLDAYRDDLEFCQIQLNYLDWDFQDAKKKVELLNEYNVPIWIMEPLRGGKLASLPKKEYEEKLKSLRPDADIPSWGFRFLQSIKGVTMTLSGMSNMEQLKDNIKTFSTNEPLNEEEFNALLEISNDITGMGTVPCTACRYCVPHCPKGLDIPYLISLYNEHTFSGGGFIAPMALSAVDENKRPKDCIACRSCEKNCPQGIKISEVMKEFDKKVKARK